MGRQTIDWEEIKTVQIPMLPQNRRQKIVNTILLAWEKEKKANQEVENVQIMLDDEFGVESEESKYRFTAYKPPK